MSSKWVPALALGTSVLAGLASALEVPPDACDVVSELLRDGRQRFKDIAAFGTHDDLALKWTLPGATSCYLVELNTGLRCKWTYDRSADNASIAADGKTLFAALAPCLRPELATVFVEAEADDGTAHLLEGKLKGSAHEISLRVSGPGVDDEHEIWLDFATFDLQTALLISKTGTLDERLEAMGSVADHRRRMTTEEINDAAAQLVDIFAAGPISDRSRSTGPRYVARIIELLVGEEHFSGADSVASRLSQSFSTLPDAEHVDAALGLYTYLRSYEALDTLVSMLTTHPDKRAAADDAFRFIVSYEQEVPMNLIWRLVELTTEDHPGALQAVSMLQTALDDRDPTELWSRYDSVNDAVLRRDIVRASGATAYASVPRILQLLKADPDPGIRAAAAATLGPNVVTHYGMIAETYRALGRTALGDPVATVRVEAIRTLGIQRGNERETRERKDIASYLTKALEQGATAPERAAAAEALVACSIWWCRERLAGQDKVMASLAESLSREHDTMVLTATLRGHAPTPVQEGVRMPRGYQQALATLSGHADSEISRMAARLSENP